MKYTSKRLSAGMIHASFATMTALMMVSVSIVSAAPDTTSEPFLIRGDHPIRLMQPLDDSTTELDPEPGIGIFFTYFNIGWPWVIGSAAGIAVLQALYGGVLIMLFGSDSGKKEEGKQKIMWALAGLLMIGLSGAILETLNPFFYQQV